MIEIAANSAIVQVPAKINLFLAVRGRRPDGYHELVTILQTVNLGDTVRVTLSGDGQVEQGLASGSQIALAFHHNGTNGVPTDDTNLVVRAARAVLDLLDVEVVPAAAGVPTAHLELDKRIPVAGGMAGGSADAAATLVACNALMGAGLSRDQVLDLAASLGADVPFCVSGGTALATGTGTATAKVLCSGAFHWVIGMSSLPLATPDVYAAWDGLSQDWEMQPDQILQGVRTGDAELLGAGLHNDLQAAAFHLRPELTEAVDAFLVDGAVGAIVSGSGPTVLALAADAAHAQELASAASDRFDRVEVASSPAGGPRLHMC